MKPSQCAQVGLSTLAATVAGLGVVALAGTFISGTVLAQECPLSAPLVLKDTQDGFAGQTGTIWTIEPDCKFTVAQQIGPKINDPYRQGRLTPEQQIHLKELLARTAVAGMPEKIGGGGPPVNARHVTIAYGTNISELTLAPGGGDLKTLRTTVDDGPASRLLELAATVKDMTGG